MLRKNKDKIKNVVVSKNDQIIEKQKRKNETVRFALLCFDGISTIVGNLMPNPL